MLSAGIENLALHRAETQEESTREPPSRRLGYTPVSIELGSYVPEFQ